MPPAPSTPSLSQALINIINTATNRANEDQQIFNPIASLWDDYLNTETVRTLPARLRKPLIALYTDISLTANKHFDTFINGSHPPRSTKPSTKISINPLGPDVQTSQPVLAPKTAKPIKAPATVQYLKDSTYAQKTATPLPSIIQSTNPKTENRTGSQPKTQSQISHKTDTRLFVRIGLDHPARKAGSFAVLSALKEQLKNNTKLLKKIQTINTKFALYTNSLTNLTALENLSNIIEKVFETCKIERQQS
ncbi:hypothetical protein OCU04_002895 [Sclerotinia nivalis]|uniref:Uncharacterized protein n=1 Tax=Sclerotinia nivalis TaxID=352851 RepID=A0A9X0DN12_9HELO|nr:hypothetical protein OCU04_002895 [Sclerotinia nivalis]